MHRRTKEINKAILKAKDRDNWTCQVTGKSKRDGWIVDGAHIFPSRNNPKPENDPTNSDYIVTLWRMKHFEFDKNKTPQDRIDWLRKNGLSKFADRLEEAYK